MEVGPNFCRESEYSSLHRYIHCIIPHSHNSSPHLIILTHASKFSLLHFHFSCTDFCLIWALIQHIHQVCIHIPSIKIYSTSQWLCNSPHSTFTSSHAVVHAMSYLYSLKSNKHIQNEVSILQSSTESLKSHISWEYQTGFVVVRIHWNHVMGQQGKHLWFRSYKFLSYYAPPLSSAQLCISNTLATLWASIGTLCFYWSQNGNMIQASMTWKLNIDKLTYQPTTDLLHLLKVAESTHRRGSSYYYNGYNTIHS